MRGFSGAVLAGALAFVAAGAQPQAALAEVPLAEASGNWGGPQGGGFYFRATLAGHEDMGRLRIWNGTDAVPQGGAPELDVADFAMTAFATVSLRVEDMAEGSVLQVITDFADESGQGQSVVQVQYRDFQYTVIGYHYHSEDLGARAESAVTDCKVDVLNGLVVENGATRSLPPMAFEEINASGWRFDSAFSRGWCTAAD